MSMKELPASASTMYSNFGYTNLDEDGQDAAKFIEAFISVCSKKKYKRYVQTT
jgi:hypothetical protein